MTEPQEHVPEAQTADASESKNRWLTVAIVLTAIAVVIAVAVIFYFRPTIVPDVGLRSAEQATVILQEAGLSAGATSELATDSVGQGLVVQQSPPPASKVPRHSSVDLTVAVTPTLSQVPGVTGLSEAAAATKLTEALYIAQAVDIFDETSERGTVIAQIPSEGTDWMTGRPVAMAVAAGPDDGTGVAVPDVLGADTATALSVLEKAGLVGYGVVTNPSSVPSSKVVRQLPDGGVVVRPGTTVLMLLDVP